ncbi:MAG: ankyrin repeat domain-containing protein [Deltaproteobacteria bacterium]|nr:ankyrin repeat domain-containing protein [Deltaproteobacteria bacterium]
MRSSLCQAALDGDLEGVRRGIARRAPLDGEDCETYDDTAEGCITGAPYYTPLGEAARMGHVEIVRALLDAGAAIDVIDYRNETPLIQAAAADQRASVELLVERGANVRHVGCLGTALASAQPGWKPNAIAIAERLLAAGSAADSAIEVWSHALALAQRDKAPKKVLLGFLAGFRLLAQHAPAAAPIVKKLEAKLGATATKEKKTAARHGDLAKATSKTWPADVTKAMGKIDSEAGRAAIEQVCTAVLSAPAAIAHPKWPALVRDVIGRSLTYGQLTKAAYGKALPLSRMGSDEGGALDQMSDDHLYTWDWVLALLARPETAANPAWADLVLEVCTAKREAIGDYSFGDEQIAALLATPHAKAHPRFAELATAAKRAFPYAKLPMR